MRKRIEVQGRENRIFKIFIFLCIGWCRFNWLSFERAQFIWRTNKFWWWFYQIVWNTSIPDNKTVHFRSRTTSRRMKHIFDRTIFVFPGKIFDECDKKLLIGLVRDKSFQFVIWLSQKMLCEQCCGYWTKVLLFCFHRDDGKFHKLRSKKKQQFWMSTDDTASTERHKHFFTFCYWMWLMRCAYLCWLVASLVIGDRAGYPAVRGLPVIRYSTKNWKMRKKKSKFR